ncbi:serine threonine protein kinase CMGC group, partial [Spiromyces aspiralis]
IRVRLDPSTYYKFYHQSGKLRYPNSKTTPKSRHDVSAVRALRDIVPPHNNIIYRELYSLLEGLLRFDPSERLTADQAKDHPFFRNIIGQHGKLVPRDQAATPVPAKPSVVQKPPAAVPSTVAFRAAPSPKQQPARMIDVAAVGSNHVHMPNTAVTVVAGSGGGGGGGCYRQAVETGPIPVSLSALASRADVVGAAIVSSSSSLSLSALESK